MEIGNFYYFFMNVLKKEMFSVTINELFLVEMMGNRSLMDRTPDSDSGNAGSIPAGCILQDIAMIEKQCYGRLYGH